MAGEQSGQSTHARERNTPKQSVSRTLSALEDKARRDPEHRFRGLARLLDRRMLAEAFGCLKRKASPGIDGVGWAEYAENLEENLTDLLERLRTGRYRARCVKRQWIAKAGSRKLRPLGIPVIEDKIVQQAVKRVLEAIWESDFHDQSIGYRTGRGARQASQDLHLHYVQDEWIVKVVSKRSRGKVLFRRYADDSVVCFERESDARAYLRALPKRLGKFSLNLADEKSALVRFNRWEPEQSGKFTFLGFDFYWARSLRNPRHVFVKRRTNRKKFRNSLKAMKEWIRKVRCRKLSDLLVVLRRKLLGHRNYYGVIGNSMMLSKYYYEVVRMLYKWLNRRSQRRSMTWAQFMRRLPGWELPPPRVVEPPVNGGLHQATKPA